MSNVTTFLCLPNELGPLSSQNRDDDTSGCCKNTTPFGFGLGVILNAVRMYPSSVTL